jgi:DNA-binding XRE family transcriptional regulator
MANHPNRNGKNPAKNPKPAEIKKARIAAGLSQTAAAELIYCALGTWQQYEADPDSPCHRRMHPAFWELFKIRVAELAD